MKSEWSILPVTSCCIVLSELLLIGTHIFLARNGSATNGDNIAPRQKHKCRACIYGPDSVPQMKGMSALPPANENKIYRNI